MKHLVVACFGVLVAFISSISCAQNQRASDKETLVFIRHAEKPKAEIGQLNCQGLNRSLKLPNVLVSKFGNPNFLFAPNPTDKIGSSYNSGTYYYIRPLATIEPTAIMLDMPINLPYGFSQVSEMAAELLNPKYATSTVFIAWEHLKLVDIVKAIYQQGQNEGVHIPAWPGSDFDSIYVLTITGNANGNASQRQISFQIDKEGLDGQNTTCM